MSLFEMSTTVSMFTYLSVCDSPVRSCDQQDSVAVERFPFHHKRHIWHLLVIQEMRVCGKTHQQVTTLFTRLLISDKEASVNSNPLYAGAY